MTVLRILNNGTWEDLNIDHASSADSAVRDGNGDVISDTYLPLTAGSTKPLTDDLYINSASIHLNSPADTNPNYWIEENGTAKGVLYHSTSNNQIRLAGWEDGSTAVGMVALPTVSGNNVIVAGSGSNIVFRPNGENNTTGQVYVNADGFLIGTKFTTGNITYTSGGATCGAYTRMGHIVQFTCFANVAGWSAGTWTNVPVSTLPLPSIHAPHFVCVATNGSTVPQQHGVARVQASTGQLQVMFQSADSNTRAVVISGVYRRDV